MSELATENGKELITWEQSLTDFKTRYSAISIADPQQYEPRRLAVAEMRKARVLIEQRRLDLGRPLLKAKKNIDDKAFFLINEIWKLEEPLKIANDAIDEEKARQKRIAEQDDRDKQQAAQQAALDRQKQEAEAERLRLKEEAERVRVDKEKAEDEAKKAREEAARIQAENAAERQRLADEQRRAREAKEAADKAERDRLAVIEAERLAAERAAQEEAERIEREKVEAARIEAMLPDVDKIRKWADQIDAVIETAPAVTSDDGWLALNDSFTTLANLATKLRAFG